MMMIIDIDKYFESGRERKKCNYIDEYVLEIKS